MACKHSLPSAADLDLVIREREMIEANSAREPQKSSGERDKSRPIYYPLWNSTYAVRLTLLIVAVLFGSSAVRANTVPVGPLTCSLSGIRGNA